MSTTPLDHPADVVLSTDELMVEVRGLVKRFPDRRGWREGIRHPFGGTKTEVLHGISLSVQAGEFFGVLGPNGAGKSTLFKILATLVLPDDGTVRIAGVDPVADPNAVRRLLTPVVPDDRSLYWRLTGRQNLELYAALYRVAPASVDTEVDQILESVGLTEAAEKMAGTYSSGMKQRLLIARALLGRPKVLLLDEPTRSLDPVGARDFREFLRTELVKRRGCTVLLATHNAEEAFGLCDRVAVLDKGTFVALGPTQELVERVRASRVRISVAASDVHRALKALADQGLSFTQDKAETEGWIVLHGTLRGGLESASDTLALLVHEGVAVAELAPAAVPLAEMIETLTSGDGHV